MTILGTTESAARAAMRYAGRDTCIGECETHAGCACWSDGQPRAAEPATDIGADDDLREPMTDAERAMLAVIYTASVSLVVALGSWIFFG